MIAPSPDWYLAIRDIELYEEDKWVTEKTVEVGVYDAGTDAGQTFSAPNKIENKPIQKITTPPLAVNGIVKRMGTMTLKKSIDQKTSTRSLLYPKRLRRSTSPKL
jgi:hypothetical protein